MTKATFCPKAQSLVLLKGGIERKNHWIMEKLISYVKYDFRQYDENDSFDEYHPYEDENAWKYANVPVRKKSEREKLKGFSCDACESYYKNVNLTDEELQDLLQKCSRHR